MIEKARLFAEEKHDGTFRKSSGLPYYTHPFAVAQRLSQFPVFGNDTELISAALLHDTLEDTDTTVKEIVREFNQDVANLVKELTSDKRLIKENLKTDPNAKAKYLVEKINSLSPRARIIKLADREDNVSDLNESDPLFAAKYAKQTDYILNHIDAATEFSSVEKNLVDSIREKIVSFLP